MSDPPTSALSRSARIKLAILAMLTALALFLDTDWAARRLGFDDYWERELVRRELALSRARTELDAARQALAEASEAERRALEAELAAAKAEVASRAAAAAAARVEVSE